MNFIVKTTREYPKIDYIILSDGSTISIDPYQILLHQGDELEACTQIPSERVMPLFIGYKHTLIYKRTFKVLNTTVHPYIPECDLITFEPKCKTPHEILVFKDKIVYINGTQSSTITRKPSSVSSETLNQLIEGVIDDLYIAIQDELGITENELAADHWCERANEVMPYLNKLFRSYITLEELK